MTERGLIGARETARAKRDAARAAEAKRWAGIEKEAAKFEGLERRRVAALDRARQIVADQATVIARLVDTHELTADEAADMLGLKPADVRRLHRDATAPSQAAVQSDTKGEVA